MKLFHLLPKLSPSQIKKKSVSKRYKLHLPFSYAYKANDFAAQLQNPYTSENNPFSLKKVPVKSKNNGYLITQMIFMTKPLIKFG